MSLPHGHARINPRHPEASGVCDRCGFRYTRSDLDWQYDWAGSSLTNKRWLVCDSCMDEPSNANRTVQLKPDPTPVRDPRPTTWALDEQSFLVSEDGSNSLTDEAGNILIKD